MRSPLTRHRPSQSRLTRRRRVAWHFARWRWALAGCCAVIAAASALLALRPPDSATVEVVTAARDLSAVEPLSPGDTTTRAIPAAIVPDGAVSPDDDPSGRSLTGPMRRGEVVTTARLADSPAAEYGPGTVAAPVRVSDPDAAALVDPGTRIDILATADHGFETADREGAAEVVAGDCPVIAVPAEGSAAASGALLLVAVSEEQARQLAARSATSQISITIRGQ